VLDRLGGERKSRGFTQNQAFNAWLFLYREILRQPLENVQALRADRPVRVPIVLTPEEVKSVIQAMSGTPQLVAKLLSGAGLRLMEVLRMRVQDLDFKLKQITVRDGKGPPSFHFCSHL
jgi:integrase